VRVKRSPLPPSVINTGGVNSISGGLLLIDELKINPGRLSPRFCRNSFRDATRPRRRFNLACARSAPRRRRWRQQRNRIINELACRIAVVCRHNKTDSVTRVVGDNPLGEAFLVQQVKVANGFRFLGISKQQSPSQRSAKLVREKCSRSARIGHAPIEYGETTLPRSVRQFSYSHQDPRR